MKGRNGEIYNVPDRLDTGDVIWARLNKCIDDYRKVDDKDRSLFLKDFDKTLANQERWVKGYLFDPIVEGRWFEELEDGRFVLYRGTNRNESLHKRYGG